ncbi:hypothetical protein BDZ91DRAFT_48753 [Kalaharituber pfeilii]|nr:hypothetical protein BDZ91DRAFT_48753 [Kalaharituber pfeilii]
MSTPSIEIASYDPSVYQSFQDFPEVAQAFRARKGKHFINTVRELYLRHNVENTFGVGLVHRHFNLAVDERLVQDGKVSTPWKLERVNNTNIVPSAWAFRNGALYPYEFELVSEGSKAPDLPPAFLRDLHALLVKNGYQDLLGINTYHKGPSHEERTEGRANILTEIVGDPASDHTAPASWAFSRSADGPPETQVVVKCDTKCDWYLDGEGILAPKVRRKL